jgi:L-alanine-DL-glutamate epimerase-like enolase superfamily enzyme
MAQPVRIHALALQPLAIPFKVSFRHASANRDEGASLWVEATSGSGLRGYGESCPRPYVTGETLDTARAFFQHHEASVSRDIVDLPTLRQWMVSHADDLDKNPAAWCAIELAILDLFAREADQPLELVLSVPPLTGRFRYTAVLGDASPEAFRAAAEQYRRFGFTDYKVKLSGDLERDRGKLEFFRAREGPVRVRADANNLWDTGDVATAFLHDLDYPFFAIEEPVRKGRYAELARMGEALGCPIILDESFLRIGQLEALRSSPSRWLINLRVSKMGGLLRSLAIIEEVRKAGIGLIIGAQVGETSVLTRAALTVAQFARDGLVAQEGAFGTFLLTHDVCDPPLMFGAGGVLDVATYPSLQQPGLGLGPIVPST